jgi:phage head maturation protease
MSDNLATILGNAVNQAMRNEILLILGRHIERKDGHGIFVFLPGHTKQMLANDLGLLCEHLLHCARGVGFAVRVTETDEAGVSAHVNVNVSTALGRNLIERGSAQP